MTLGDVRVRFYCGGRLSLDGGAMFGIIPKPLWSRSVRCDERNRIPLTTTCLLVETAGRRVLIETGVGGKYDAKDREIFALSDAWLLDSLAADGVSVDSIDTVILTHLHFDHAGGVSCLDANGSIVPTFPAARFVVQRGEWDDAVAGHFVMTGTYRRENLEPLEQSGRMELIDGEAEIAPGVSVLPLPGHTRHQQGVLIRGGGRTLLQPADLLPTAAHVGLRWNMAYDLLPYENMRTKSRMLEAAQAGDWTIVTAQDPDWQAWRVQRTDRGFALARDERT